VISHITTINDGIIEVEMRLYNLNGTAPSLFCSFWRILSSAYRKVVYHRGQFGEVSLLSKNVMLLTLVVFLLILWSGSYFILLSSKFL